MNPLSLAPLTSAAAALAVGATCSYQLPLPPDCYRLSPAYVSLPTATAMPLSDPVEAGADEPNSSPLASRIWEHLSYLREVSRGAGQLISLQIAQQAASAWLECWQA